MAIGGEFEPATHAAAPPFHAGLPLSVPEYR